MLKPLPNSLLVRETDRRTYADEAMSLTVWLGKEIDYIAFELVFDLTLNEFAVRRLGDKLGRYFRVNEGESRPGRHGKQFYDEVKVYLPRSRLTDFEARSANLPTNLRSYVLETLQQLLNPNRETKVDDGEQAEGNSRSC
jgi:hypothetical protein